jgi:hypothetical protein
MLGIGSGRMGRKKKVNISRADGKWRFSDKAKFMTKEGRTKTTKSDGKEQKEQSNQTDSTYK